MKTIASFTVNHDTLLPGLYVSRVDGDIVTYDVRMKVPNSGDYLPTPAAHTIEHLFATYARNSGYGMSYRLLSAPARQRQPRRSHPAGAGQLCLHCRL